MEVQVGVAVEVGVSVVAGVLVGVLVIVGVGVGVVHPPHAPKLGVGLVQVSLVGAGLSHAPNPRSEQVESFRHAVPGSLVHPPGIAGQSPDTKQLVAELAQPPATAATVTPQVPP